MPSDELPGWDARDEDLKGRVVMLSPIGVTMNDGTYLYVRLADVLKVIPGRRRGFYGSCPIDFRLKGSVLLGIA
jgi:hypothetical protein